MPHYSYVEMGEDLLDGWGVDTQERSDLSVEDVVGESGTPERMLCLLALICDQQQQQTKLLERIVAAVERLPPPETPQPSAAATRPWRPLHVPDQ